MKGQTNRPHWSIKIISLFAVCHTYIQSYLWLCKFYNYLDKLLKTASSQSEVGWNNFIYRFSLCHLGTDNWGFVLIQLGISLWKCCDLPNITKLSWLPGCTLARRTGWPFPGESIWIKSFSNESHYTLFSWTLRGFIQNWTCTGGCLFNCWNFEQRPVRDKGLTSYVKANIL